MNSDNAIGNLGIALGLLQANQECQILLDGEWKTVLGTTRTPDGSTYASVEDILLILTAEEVA